MQEWHKLGLVHGAVNFNNVLIGASNVKVTDFDKKSRDEFYAPEYYKDKTSITLASDIWMLGILLFKMLYGVFPFTGKPEVI